MAFCTACGKELTSGWAYCAFCGTPTGSAPASTPGDTPAGAQVASSGLEENIAGLLCYALGWVTGLIFLLIDKRPTVRFHAMQSLIAFGALNLLSMLLGGIGFMHFGGFMGGHFGWSSSWFLAGIVHLIGFVAWIVCMVKAFQGHRYKLPIIGDIAENYAR